MSTKLEIERKMPDLTPTTKGLGAALVPLLALAVVDESASVRIAAVIAIAVVCAAAAIGDAWIRVARNRHAESLREQINSVASDPAHSDDARM